MAQSPVIEAHSGEEQPPNSVKNNQGLWLLSPAFQWLWLALGSGLCLVLGSDIEWLNVFPEQWQLPFVDIFNQLMQSFITFSAPAFKAVALLLAYPMNWIRDLLHWLPWSVVMLLTALISYRAGGIKLVLLSVISLLYMLVTGLWGASMNSLALVLISVPLAVLLGFSLGVLGFFSARFQRFLLPVLDVAQTVPAFAYLLPILLLFGFGPVVGLIASILFAFAPMVRNTLIGLKQVDLQVIESGVMSGATPWQLFTLVRLPSALKQILLGVNQTTMASLSMVIIASIIGGTADIGWEVLSTMRKAQFGESLVAGLVIVLLAMMLDRITSGLAQGRAQSVNLRTNGRAKKRLITIFNSKPLAASMLGKIIVLLAAVASLFLVSAIFDVLWRWPEIWIVDFSHYLNAGIAQFISDFKSVLTSVKNNTLFFIMLPLKIGLDKAISPFTWGFSALWWHWLLYSLAVLAIAIACTVKKRYHWAAASLLLAMVFYQGLVAFPWPIFCVVLVFSAYRIGGASLALATLFGLGFLLLSGSWKKVMLSLYLCGIAIFIAFVWGTLLGILAASHRGFSNFMRPINDALQTMPPFVLLIPFVMLFKIGEFTAMLAIIFYAYVPAFRYCEFGLRKVPDEIVEAATSMGTTSLQLLFQVKLPLALPNIMLGLNQSIMYGISMLVITALVGTNGLGQQVYIGLSKGDFGIGIVAGMGMAIIAMLADRFCQAWQRKYAAKL